MKQDSPRPGTYKLQFPRLMVDREGRLSLKLLVDGVDHEAEVPSGIAEEWIPAICKSLRRQSDGPAFRPSSGGTET